MSESLLEKYPHLKLLSKLKKPPVLGLPVPAAAHAKADENEHTMSSLPSSGRISLIGPGVGVPLFLSTLLLVTFHTRTCLQKTFLLLPWPLTMTSVYIQVEDAVPAKQQLD